MKNTKRTMSFLFATVLVMLFTLIASIGVAADSGVDPVIIDFSSQAAAEAYVNFTSYPPNTVKDEGYYTFDTAEGALSILPTESVTIEGKDHGTMRYSLKPNAADLFIGTPYMVVTYKTNISNEPLRMYNLWGHFCTLASDIGVSNGNYVKSEPINIDISPVNSVNANYFNRFNNGMHHNMISIIDSSVPSGDPYFYIKEVAFFATQEEADAYAVNPVYPVIIDMSSMESINRYAELPDHPLLGNGSASFNAEEGAFALGYAEGTSSDAEYNAVYAKCGIKIKNTGVLAGGQKYMVVTYKTNIDEAIPLKLNNIMGMAARNNVTLDADVSESNGNWVHSEPVNIDNGSANNANHFHRFAIASNNILFLEGIGADTDFTGKYFYIKEIAFFATQEEADAYAVDPVQPVIINMSSMETINRYAELPDHPLLGNVSASFNAEEGAFALGYAAGTSGDAEYDAVYVKCGIKIKNTGILADGQKYMVVTYKTNIDEAVPLKLNNIMGMAAQNNVTLDADVSESKGNWVHSEPINIDNGAANGGNHFYRFAIASNNVLFLEGIGADTDFTGKYFYIKEIAFFATEEEANEYAVDPVQPVIIDMSSMETVNRYAELPDHPLLGNGSASFNAEEGALSLGYAAGTSGDAAYDAVYVKCGIKTKNAGILADGQKYMVVTYKTNIDEAVSLKLNNVRAMTASQNFTLAADVSESNGNWVHSEPVNIDNGSAVSGNHFQRFNTANTNILFLDGVGADTDFAGKYFYIKEIAFFPSAEAAEEYYAQTPDEPETVYGDADGDGEITVLDLANLGKALAKWKGFALPEDESVLDLNSDGKVNPLDLVYLARHLAGWDDYKVLPIA